MSSWATSMRRARSVAATSPLRTASRWTRPSADDEQVVAGEAAVGDARRAQRGQLVPGVGQDRVGDLVVGNLRRAAAVDVLEGEQRGVGADLRRRDQRGRARPGGGRGVRQQRLVLERATDGDVRASGCRPAHAQQPPRAVAQPGALLVPVEDRDVDERPVRRAVAR